MQSPSGPKNDPPKSVEPVTVSTSKTNFSSINYTPFSRAPAIIAILLVGGVYATILPSLSLGPRWLLFVVISVLVALTVIFQETGAHRVARIFGYISNSVISIALLGSVVLLILTLPEKKQQSAQLLLSGASLWITNIFVFALWYWRMDAGGPELRNAKMKQSSKLHTHGDFLFPQMLFNKEVREELHQMHWVPGFIDYLFLAFNTSTAFSPTDTTALTGWAKCLMMMQSIISLSCIAVLVSRAINIM